MFRIRLSIFFVVVTGCFQAYGQDTVPIQPFALHVRQLETALDYLGEPLPLSDQKAINEAIGQPDEAHAVNQIEEVLDKHVLCFVEINAESRVKVETGTAKPELVESGTRLFLVKVNNLAHVTAPLVVESPNSGHVYIPSKNDPEPKLELTPHDAAERWADISLFNKQPMNKRLTGLPVEYQILEVYSRDRGQRAAKISFNVGQGSQDIGFRNDTLIVFNALPAHRITLRVRDEKGNPATASFLVRDRQNRIYPNPSKRLAPDFFFQPQVYRSDGETLDLPDGYYTITYTATQIPDTHERTWSECRGAIGNTPFVPSAGSTHPNWLVFDAITTSTPAGYSHYQNPTEGVPPSDMNRQVRGENLNIAAVLTWGPDYYYPETVLYRPGFWFCSSCHFF